MGKLRQSTAEIQRILDEASGLYTAVEAEKDRAVQAESDLGTAIDELDSKFGERLDNIESKIDSIRPDIPSSPNVYASGITDKELEIPDKVGGISKGVKVSELEGKTFSELFDDLLFPTIDPSFVNPSSTLSWSGYGSVQEVGANGPADANFVTAYNAGSILINGVKQSDRAGEHDKGESFIYVNNNVDNRTIPAKVTLGNTTFKYRAAYAAGPQPKNNKGEDYGSPLPAGHVDSPSITLNGTYPWYASTASASSTNPVVKQPLVAWNEGSMSTGNFALQPSGTLPQVFKLPRKIKTLQMLNTVSNAMETISTSDYEETTEIMTIGGSDVTYYVYTYKGAARGSVTLLARF